MSNFERSKKNKIKRSINQNVTIIIATIKYFRQNYKFFGACLRWGKNLVTCDKSKAYCKSS